MVFGSVLGFSSASAEFADGEPDIQTRVHGDYNTITSTYNLPSDPSVYVYARSVEFYPQQGGAIGGGTGDLYPTQDSFYSTIPVRIDFRLVNNSDSFYKITGFSFDIHNYNPSAIINLLNYDFGGLTVASVTRPSDLANQVQRWSMIPDGGYLSLAPGQSVYYSGYIYYGYPDKVSAIDCVHQFQVISLTGAVMDAVDNNQGATAGGQNKIDQSIHDQYNASDEDKNDISGSVSDSVDEIGNIGIFSFLISFLQQFIGVFQETGSTALTFPGFSIASGGVTYQVWESHTFDFASLEDDFGALLAAVRLGTSVIVIGAFIDYLYRLYEHIFGGDAIDT